MTGPGVTGCALIAAALFAATPSVAGDFDETKCFLSDQAGNRFQFTDIRRIWLYEPVDGTDEFCAYGPDESQPDFAFTVTCEQHGIDAVVVNGHSAATILGRKWTRMCRPDV